MSLSRLGGIAALLCAVTGSAFASSITMTGGKDQIPFDTLTFDITLSSTGTQCLENGNPVNCVFQNEVGDVITQIDLTFQIPSLPSSDTCSVTATSPFQQCNVAFVTIGGSGGPTYEEIFEFYDGSLPNTNEFGLNFSDFPGGSIFSAAAATDPDVSSAPEPGSAMLLLVALAGVLILIRSRN